MKKRILSIALSVTLILSLLPATALAAGEAVTLDISGGSITITATGYSVGGGAETAYTGAYILTGSSGANTVTVASGNHAITLRDLSISLGGSGRVSPFTVQSGAEAAVTLVGSSRLTADGYSADWSNAALRVPAGATLTVTAESTGSLTTDSEYMAAGIGGSSGEDAGTVNIHGGTINATGGVGAGIGGGAGYLQGGITPGDGGRVVITGGVVNATATTNDGGAGIGGGGQHNRNGGEAPTAGGAAGVIEISGGYVNVTGNPGIGCGNYATEGGSVSITGGFVTARGIQGSDPIGAGAGSAAAMETVFDDCIIITKPDYQTGQGTVYGDATLEFDYDLSTKTTLTIPAGATLTVPEGVTLNSFGAIQNNGALTGAGTVYGVVEGNPPTDTLTYADAAPAAEVGDEAALRAAVAHEVWTVKLTADITLTSALQLSGTGTLEGGGHTVTLTGANSGDYIDVQYNSAVAFSDLTLTSSNAAQNSLLRVNGPSAVTMANCLITGGKTGVLNSGTLAMTDCTVSGNSGTGIEGGNVQLRRCLIIGNGNTGVYTSREGQACLLNTIVTGNVRADHHPGGLLGDHPCVTGSIVLGNHTASGGTATPSDLLAERGGLVTDSVVGAVSPDWSGSTTLPEVVLDSQVNELVELGSVFADLTTATVNGVEISLPAVDNTKRGIAAVALTEEWAAKLAAQPKVILSVKGYEGPLVRDEMGPHVDAYGLTMISSVPCTAYFSDEPLTAENYLEKGSTRQEEFTLWGVGQRTVYYYITRDGYPDAAGSTQIVVTKGEGSALRADAYSFQAETMTLSSAQSTMEYSVDGGVSWKDFEMSGWWADNVPVSGVTAQLDLWLRNKEDANYYASPAAVIPVEQQEKPAGVTATQPTGSGETGTISGVTDQMEYSADDGENWTTGSGSDLTGIPQGTTYLVRTKAAGNALPSDPIAVTVFAYDAAPTETPIADIDFDAETLTGLSGDVLVDGTPYAADGVLPIQESWFGTTVAVVQCGDGMTTKDSAPQSLDIPARAAAPTVSVTDESYPGAGDGAITGDSAMECRPSDSAAWSGETAGLAAGTYYVRVKATSGAFAGEAATVRIASAPARQEATPTVTVSADNRALENLAPNGAYAINGAAYTADGNGKIAMSPVWNGTTLQIVKKGNGTSTTDSAAQYLTVSYTETYTVTYDVNGGTGTVTDNVRYAQGDTVTVGFGTIPQKEGFTFHGWATSPDAVAPTYTADGTNTFVMGTEDVTLYAVWGTTAVPYLDAGGTQQTCYHAAELTDATAAWPEGWYVVSGEVTISQRITVTGDVHLILADGCRLTAQEGISVAEAGSRLTIYAQSAEEAAMGRLDATGNGDNAGIGGDGAQNNGVITINGGKVTARSTGYGAGIGGGGRSDGSADNTMRGVITINGGVVTAQSGNVNHAAAGIGGGKGNGGGTITINGGKVTAIADKWGYSGAGIGGGSWYGGTDTAITITGGEVVATGGGSSAGIGGGCNSGGGTITISGGSVTATGGSAGIGGGSDHAGNGSFSTGEGGSAVIFASSIGNTGGESEWKGVIFQGNGGQVYGDITITKDLTVPKSATLTVPAGSSLTIPQGVTFTNEGAVQNDGAVTNNGTILDYTGWTSTPPDGSGQCINTHPVITASVSAPSVTYGDTVTISATALLPAGADVADFPADGSLMARFTVNNKPLGEPVPLTVDGAANTISASLTVSGEAQWGTDWTAGENTVSVEFDPIIAFRLLGGIGTATLEVAARERSVSDPEVERVRATAVTLKEAALEPNVGTLRYGYAQQGEETIHWNYSDSRSFTGLTPETTYSFYVKAELENYYQAVQAGPVEVTTTAAQLFDNTVYLNDGNITITGGEDGAVSVTQGSAVYSIPAGEPLRITGEGETTRNTISVQGGEVKLILDGVQQQSYDHMGGMGGDGAAITVEGDGTKVTLVLEGENFLAKPEGYSGGDGIHVKENSSLTIGGTGTLTIGGEHTSVGIWTENGSSLTVDGGTLDITARSVAIGSPNLSSGQTASITVNGGVVKTNVASEYSSGVGIGTRPNWYSNGSMNIAVNGGSLELSGEGNNICAAGSGASGAVTIAGGSISTAGTISPAPTDGAQNPLVPVTVVTGKSGAAVGDLMLTNTAYGAPAQTDGNGNLTLYLPEGAYTGLAIVDGEVQKVTATAAQDGSGAGSTESTGVHVEIPENTKPTIKPDGNIELPGGSSVQTGEGPAITLPSGGSTDTTGAVSGDKVQIGNTTVTGPGTTVTPTGEVTVPDNGTVKTGEGPEITLPDGGTADKTGNVTADKVQLGNTTVTGTGTTVTPTGQVTVPNNGTIKTGEGPTITLPDGGTADPTGGVTVPEGGTVQVGDTTITPPSGGVVTPGENGAVTVPSGSTVQTGEGPIVTLPVGGATDATGNVTGDKVQVGNTTVTGEGATVTPTGAVTVPTNGTVQTGDGPVVTLPDGGTTDTTGSVTGDKVQIGNTTVTGTGTAVTPAGEVTVPTGGTVQTGEGPAITLPDGGSTDKDGGVTVPEGGTVQVGDTTITPPSGGVVTPGENGAVTVPAGSTVQTGDGEPIVIPETGGTVTPGGEIQYTVTITWIVDGVETTTQVAHGETPTYDGTPTKASTDAETYTFAGWAPELVPATANATYTAQFTAAPRTYTVTLNADGGAINSGDVATYTCGTAVELPTDVTKEGYTFGGWYATEDCSGSPVTQIPAAATGDKTYYAKWTEKHKIVEIAPGDTVTLPGDAGTVTGNDDGTVTVTDSQGTQTTVTPPADGGKVTVNTETGEITVPGGSTVQTGESGVTVTLPDGGEVTPGGTVSGSSIQVGDTTVTVTQPQGEAVTAGPDGAVTIPSGSTVQTGEGPVITLPDGGSTDATGNVTADKVQVSDTVITGEGTTVTPTGEVTVPTNGTVQTGEGPAITLPDGGNTDATGNMTADKVQIGDTVVTGEGTTVTPTGEVTVPTGGTVQTGEGPAITLPDGGSTDTTGGVSVPEGGKIQVGDTTITPPSGGVVTPGENGKVNVPGGSTVQTGDREPIVIPETGGSIVPGGEVEYTVTVTFDTQDGASTTSQSVPAGSKVTKPSDPTRTGYTFGGWYTEADCTTEWDFDTDVTASMTLYAKWTAQPSGGSSSSGSSTRKPSVSVGGSGEGGKVTAGRDGTVTITPDAGCEIIKITVNGKEVDIPENGKLTGLKRTDKVVVTFGAVAHNVPVTLRFADVPEGAWYEDAVQYVVDNGLFNGTSDTTFSPNGDMTRGMLATVLYRLAQEPEMTGEELFKDVADGQYYSQGIAWAAEKGIVTGYGNGTFGPDDPITREQLAAMLWRYAGKPTVAGSLGGFTDGAKTSEYALPALQWAVEQGIVTGKGNGILDPQGQATRAEVAAMLMRYIQATDK